MEPSMFDITVSPWELVARGTIMYVGLMLVMRFVLRRDVGSMSVTDVLFLVLLSDAAQNAMAGEYTSVTDGLVLVGTLIGWNLLLDWSASRWKLVRRFTEAPPLPLIRNGKWLRDNMKRQWITTDELRSQLREHGIEDLACVKVAILEPSGELSVIKVDGGEVEKPTRHEAAK
jgi:uncharacterized membrane protein YcaP (DUF421 family)